MEPGAGRARFDGGCSLREDAEGTCSSHNKAGTVETIMKAIALVASAALVCLAPAVRAADYRPPNTMMIGSRPGGPSDVMARILTRKIEEILKQPLVIENRAGAGGGIAGAAVARATPDGYTVLLATGSLLAINVSLYHKNLGYDPEKRLRADHGDRNPDQRSLHPSLGAGEIAGRADRLCQGQSGQAHLRLRRQRHAGPSRGRASQDGSQTRDDPCPFRGTGPALQAVIGGHVPMAYNPPPPLLPHLQSGSIRALAITTLKRTAALPEVPTIAELGFPGFEATTWHGIVAPAGTPKDVVATLHRASVAAVNDPEVRKALTELGVDVVGNTPGEFRAYIKSEIPKWAAIVKASGARWTDAHILISIVVGHLVGRFRRSYSFAARSCPDWNSLPCSFVNLALIANRP